MDKIINLSKEGATITVSSTGVTIITKKFSLTTTSFQTMAEVINHAMDRKELPQDTWGLLQETIMELWFEQFNIPKS